MEQLTADLSMIMETDDVPRRIIEIVHGKDAEMDKDYELDCALIPTPVFRELQALVKSTGRVHDNDGGATTIEHHKETHQSKEVSVLRRERSALQSSIDKMKMERAKRDVQLKELRAKLAALENDNNDGLWVCNICTEKTADTHAYVPCGHVACGTCVASMERNVKKKDRNCPFCRASYTATHKLHLSS